MSDPISEIRARLKAATPGPWGERWGADALGVVYRAQGPMHSSESRTRAEADAKLIAHAPSDIAFLLAEVGRLKSILAQEASDNDELGAEYTLVRIQRDEIRKLRAEAAAYRSALEQAQKDICGSNCIHGPPRPHCPACVDATTALATAGKERKDD